MGLFDWVIDQLREHNAIEEAAEEGYNTAMDMCGNDGQVSVIDMTGVDAFHDAAEAAATNGDAARVLVSACPYPEAVHEILDEAAAVIEGIISDATDGILGNDDGDADEEGDDGEELFDL